MSGHAVCSCGLAVRVTTATFARLTLPRATCQYVDCQRPSDNARGASWCRVLARNNIFELRARTRVDGMVGAAIATRQSSLPLSRISFCNTSRIGEAAHPGPFSEGGAASSNDIAAISAKACTTPGLPPRPPQKKSALFGSSVLASQLGSILHRGEQTIS